MLDNISKLISHSKNNLKFDIIPFTNLNDPLIKFGNTDTEIF